MGRSEFSLLRPSGRGGGGAGRSQDRLRPRDSVGSAGKQIGFRFRTWGGARTGAGRPQSSRSVSHGTRPRVTRHVPLHVTLRLVGGLPSLRERKTFRVVREAFGVPRAGDARIVHYSVQSNHIHLLVETEDAQRLAQGIQALTIRLAKRLNRSLSRRGRIFADRFHVRRLRTPLEVRRALAYLLNNYRRHVDGTGPRLPLAFRDPLSSALWFDGWDPEWIHVPPDRRALRDPLPQLEAGVTPPRSFLLRRGWRRHGLLRPFDGSDSS